jgi:predicted small secreted protein
MPVLTASLLSGLSFALAACNTTEGAGKDIKNTGQAIENTADENKPT